MLDRLGRPALATCLAAAALALAACGGDDETTSATTATGATGPTGAAGAATGLTVAEFIAELQPQKQEILEQITAAAPECKGLEVDNSFVLLVSAKAIDADQDAPIESIVTGEC
jgi:hypothetical protein